MLKEKDVQLVLYNIGAEGLKNTVNNFVSNSAIINAFDPCQVMLDREEETLYLEDVYQETSVKFFLTIPSEIDIHRLNGYNLIENEDLLNRLIITRVEVYQYCPDSFDQDEEPEDDREEAHQQFISERLLLTLQNIYLHFKFIPYFKIDRPVDYGFCPPSNIKYCVIEVPKSHIKDLISIVKIIPAPRERAINARSLNIDRHKHFFRQNLTRNETPISIVQTNTKARRIGYLKYIIGKFEKSPYFPTSVLSRVVERESLTINHELAEYKSKHAGNDKGVIQVTKNGTSAQPYIQLLQNLNITTEISRAIILTKQTKVYAHLNSKSKADSFLMSKLNLDADLFTVKEDNAFKLNLLDRMFFLKQILIHDALYFIALCDIINIIDRRFKTQEIISLFQNYVIDELQRTTYHIRKEQLPEVRTIKERILSWKKPKTYMEHIIEPRLNWLIDLGFLKTELVEGTTYYQSTIYGRKFSEILLGIFEDWFIKHIHMKKYLENCFFTISSYVFNIQAIEATNISKIVVETKLLEAFSIFKTEAPKRIAASQAIEYVCYKSFLCDRLIYEFDQIKNFLLDKKSNKFILEWYSSENDGALYIIN